MKNYKKAFTLTETLVALGIIGIVAALTVPALMNNVQNSAIQPSRDRAVNLLQSALADVISRAQADNAESGITTNLASISDTDLRLNNNNPQLLVQSNTTDLFSRCSGFMGLEEVPANEANAYLGTLRNGNNAALSATYRNINNAHVYKFKKTNQYIIVENFPNIPNDVSEDAILTRIFIDANGANGDNTLDDDVFVYGLGNNGNIYSENSSECHNNTNPITNPAHVCK